MANSQNERFAPLSRLESATVASNPIILGKTVAPSQFFLLSRFSFDPTPAICSLLLVFHPKWPGCAALFQNSQLVFARFDLGAAG